MKSVSILNNKNYRNGGVSLTAVMFGTIVLSLICLSFIAQMRSGLSQNVAYTTSQAAYDAALSGTHDVQLAIGECQRNPAANPTDCAALLQGNVGGDCTLMPAIVSRIIGLPTGVVDDGSNQRYTCIEVAPSTVSFRGQLASGDNIAHVPLTVALGSGNVEWARISYGASSMNVPSASGGTGTIANPAVSSTTACNAAGSNHGYVLNLQNRGNVLCNSRYFRSTSNTSDLVAMSFELQQAPTNFTLNQMSDNSGDRTNHGYLLLAPTTSGSNIKNAMVDVESRQVRVGLAGSADKANNSPVPIRCTTTGFTSVRNDGTNYRCDTYIKLPNPVGANRDEQMSFISLSLPAIENATNFEISYYGGTADAPNANPMIMGETQYEVFVQGQAGDRVRRIRSWIGGIQNGTNDIVPKYSAAITGGGITKCGQGATSNPDHCDTDGNGGYLIGELKETYINYTDFIVCEHKYWNTNETGSNATPRPSANNANAGLNLNRCALN